ncbi:DUF5634 family protein [Priestia filamentosa]|uniref:DUF5634 family protein n=1 Tax=Priestia filamentosa TaxID=1402861 RepID=UPI00397815EA
MNFLEEQTIINSMEQHAKRIKEMFGIPSNVQVYTEETEDPSICYLGYSFTWKEEPVIIKMKYIKNKVHQLSGIQQENYWHVKHGIHESSQHRTLGDVFDVLNIKRVG